MPSSKDRPPLVLIIDDEPDIRSSIRYLLEDYEYDVLEASDGGEGLEMCREHTPDMVLCDLRMPGMDGLQVLSALQRTSPQTPVIVITGTAISEDVEEALRMGATSYLVKPIIDLNILLKQVDSVLGIEREE